MSFYRLHDWDQSQKGMILCGDDPAKLHEWNRQGFGIFETVQEFNGARRIENLRRIRAWSVDMDRGTKKQQEQRLRKTPLKPSLVVETKNGHHAYWFAKPGASTDAFKTIVLRLIEFFDADPNAKDLARVMRVPGFLHQKDPADPFLVRRASGPFPYCYSDREMLVCFPRSSEEGPKGTRTTSVRIPSSGVEGDSFWERAFDLHAVEALSRLSGHPAVNGEVFGFEAQRNGNINIFVNGESTSCFVDEHGKIGSSDKGGPGVAQWLTWYGHSYRDVRRILLDVFPDLEAAS